MNSDKADADRLAKDGLTLGGISKLRAEWFERTQESPEQVYGMAFPKGAWRLVAEDLRRQRRKCQDTGLAGSIDIALYTASEMVHGWSPWDALVHQQFASEEAFGKSDSTAQRLLRESCYAILNSEFLGRQVG